MRRRCDRCGGCGHASLRRAEFPASGTGGGSAARDGGVCDCRAQYCKRRDKDSREVDAVYSDSGCAGAVVCDRAAAYAGAVVCDRAADRAGAAVVCDRTADRAGAAAVCGRAAAYAGAVVCDRAAAYAGAAGVPESEHRLRTGLWSAAISEHRVWTGLQPAAESEYGLRTELRSAVLSEHRIWTGVRRELRSADSTSKKEPCSAVDCAGGHSWCRAACDRAGVHSFSRGQPYRAGYVDVE